MRIAIIEDTPWAAREIIEELQAIGHEVLWNDGFDDPPRIAEEVDAFQPELILLDHFLGGDTIGSDVAAHLNLSVPIVGIGSCGNTGDYCNIELRSKEPEEVVDYLETLQKK